MLTHRGFSAWIVSEGEQIREYLVALDKNANKVSCWIPSETGKTFSVHWRDEGTDVHSCTFITLDGFVVPGRFLFGEGTASREGIRTGPCTERPFVFAQTQSSCTSGQSTKDSGTIMLKVKRVKLQGSKPANPLQNLPDWTSQSHIGEHCIGYGEERSSFTQSPTTWKVEPFDDSQKSYVTFVFRYRSREWLMTQGIISDEDSTAVPIKNHRPAKRRVASAPIRRPITPSPSPSPDPNKLDRISLSLKGAFLPGHSRMRPVLNIRTVSAKGPGSYDRYPGEGMFDPGPPSDPSRFAGGSGSASRESERTAVDSSMLNDESKILL